MFDKSARTHHYLPACTPAEKALVIIIHISSDRWQTAAIKLSQIMYKKYLAHRLKLAF
jgi:hypothetical protein